MLLTIDPQTYRNNWVCYVLTDAAGQTFTINIVRFTALTMLDGVAMPKDGPVYLTVIDQDEDYNKVWNRVSGSLSQRGFNHLRERMQEIAATLQAGKRRGVPVICNETGERFETATEAAKTHGVSYNQLIRHLNGEIGYKTVKKRTYQKINV